MKTLAIIGASGHGKVVADAARSCSLWQKVVFYDDAWPIKTTNGNFAVVGNTKSLLDLEDKPDFVVAIGNNNVRFEKQQQLVKAGFTPATVVHAGAVVSSQAVVGLGSVIMAGVVINADSVIGAACIINTNAVVEHDCILGDAVHISPGACLAGGVKVGDASWVGIGASVIQLISIGKNVVVGAGAAVVKHLGDNVTAVGVPAKIIKS
jgi:sugar O-acyltransferase (sialic acid O-acetyltransferase NeuD family)